MIFMGVDPSLRGCGVTIIDHNKKVLLFDVFGYTLSDKTEHERIKRNLIISQDVVKMGKKMDVDVIAVEGLGIAPKKNRLGNQIYLAEFIGILKSQIYLSLRKIPMIVPPPSWKKAVIGSGKADKAEIKKCLEKRNYKFKVQDQYDALGVALFALQNKQHIINGRILC